MRSVLPSLASCPRVTDVETISTVGFDFSIPRERRLNILAEGCGDRAPAGLDGGCGVRSARPGISFETVLWSFVESTRLQDFWGNCGYRCGDGGRLMHR